MLPGQRFAVREVFSSQILHIISHIIYNFVISFSHIAVIVIIEERKQPVTKLTEQMNILQQFILFSFSVRAGARPARTDMKQIISNFDFHTFSPFQ